MCLVLFLKILTLGPPRSRSRGKVSSSRGAIEISGHEGGNGGLEQVSGPQSSYPIGWLLATFFTENNSSVWDTIKYMFF